MFDLLDLLSPEAMEDMVLSHPWNFIVWSFFVFALGFFVGRHKSGIVTFYDLTKRQRAILAGLRRQGGVECAVDAEVIQLVSLGLSAEKHGYDVDFKSKPHPFMLTTDGNRMLNFHPIGRRISATRTA